MNPLNETVNFNDVALMRPQRLCTPGSWVGHIPFAFWLVAQTEPRLLVELGTHTGNSYFAFCQAVLTNRLSTCCFAVDTWEGDPHAGYYGEAVFADVSQHNEQHYAPFSKLIRSTFATAVDSFADGSIDLLHIDGLHSYEAVREDFETWQPKLSDRAIVLFHDTSVRHDEEFGVWKFWEELTEQYPHIHFDHSNGLGVLLVGKKQPSALQPLLETNQKNHGIHREQELFTSLGRGLELELKNKDLDRIIHEYCQVVEERDASINDLIQQRDATQSLVREQQEVLSRVTLECDVMLASRSWRLTRPLRWCGERLRTVRNYVKGKRAACLASMRPYFKKTYHRLPLNVSQKSALRSWYYRLLASKIWRHRKPSAQSVLGSVQTGLAMQSARGQILLIERWVPRSDQDAGSVMIFNFIKIFRNLGYAVTFLPVDLTYDPYYTPLLEKLGVVCLHSPEVCSLRQHLAACGANYDLVLTCRPDFTDPILHLLKAFCPQAKIIYETHDLHFIREQRQAEIEKKPEMLVQAAQRKLQELRIAATVDCTLVVSEQEREALLKENPELSVEVIPVISEIFGCRASFADRRDLVFIGGYEHRPNVDAVIFFVRDILPLVIQQIPDICLHVVGSHPPEEITSLASKNVVIHGFVRDITELMDRVKISVNPLRFGAGVKGKVVTSMSYGVPCIGTGIAVEGMGVVAGQQALVADDPEAFAQAVVQLSTDQALWDKLSAESLDFVRQRFSLEVAEASFVRIFENLIPVKACKSFTLERVTSYDQFCNLERDKEIAHHQEIEASFAAKQEPINTDGFCFICNQRVLFGTDLQYGFPQPDGGCLPNWRERMVCPDCQFNNRIRASIHLFHLLCNPTPESHLYLTEQVTPLFTWFQNNYPHVTGSEYLGTTVARGMINQSGFRNEDLTQLTFADEEFDAILSFDVFEYIPDYLQAMRECLRCLKPEGELFFSVPFNHQSRQNIVRAEIDADGELNHLLPPEYHGNPISENGCLCYYHFGWELLEQLRGLGFSDVATYIYWSEDFGYLGGDQLIFRATK